MNLRLLILALALSLAIPLPAQSGTKVPVTTTSSEALESYLKGRDLSEKLRGQEARAHFDRAIELDADFRHGLPVGVSHSSDWTGILRIPRNRSRKDR